MLKPIDKTDLEMILEWRNNPEVRKNMYTSHEISWEEHLNWFERLADDLSRHYFLFNNGHADAGVVYFTDYLPERGNAFWGFYAGNEAPGGTGIMMEYEALCYAFDTLKLHKLNCEVISYNQAVINLHKKTGFIEEGRFRDLHYFEGNYYDVVRLGMLESEWPQAKEKLEKRITLIRNQP